MVKKFTKDDKDNYASAVELSRNILKPLINNQNGSFERALSLSECGISMGRIKQMEEFGDWSVTEQEAEKLFNRCGSDAYTFDLIKSISERMIGEYALPDHIIEFIKRFLNGTIKRPRNHRPKIYKKFLIIFYLMQIEDQYKIKPHKGGIEAMAQGTNLTYQNIEIIWNTRKKVSSTSSGLAFDNLLKLIEEMENMENMENKLPMIEFKDNFSINGLMKYLNKELYLKKKKGGILDSARMKYLRSKYF